MAREAQRQIGCYISAEHDKILKSLVKSERRTIRAVIEIALETLAEKRKAEQS